MKLKSSLIAEATGRLGGLCFQMQHGSITARALPLKCNSATTHQSAHRKAFYDTVFRWRGMNKRFRNLWSIYANQIHVTGRLGSKIKLTGRQHFLRSNVIRRDLPGILWPIQNAPLEYNLGSSGRVHTVAADIGDYGTLNLRVLYSLDDAPPVMTYQDFTFFHVTLPVNASVTKRRIPYAFQGLYQCYQQGEYPDPFTLVFPYSSVFPPPTVGPYLAAHVGKRVFFKFQCSRKDGRLSNPIESSVIITTYNP